MIESSMNSGTTERASRRAALVTIALAAYGTWCALQVGSSWPVSAPLLAFYAILVVNTYFSVRCFATIAPNPDRVQRLADCVLAVLYAALASSVVHPTRFATFAVMLFAVTLVKYEALLRRGEATSLLLRKLRVNSLGTLACALALAGMMAGLEREASWSLALVFALANVYLLRIRPLYALEGAA